MDERLSVSWSAYQKNICNGFSFLQQRGEFVDMTLAADGHYVQVHKMVLSLVSPYIKELVATAQRAHPVIFLNNVSSATLQYILEYVYTGEALVPKDKIQEFLQACNSLKIKGLEHPNTVEQSKDLGSLSEVSSISKPVVKKPRTVSSLDDGEEKDPIDSSFDGGEDKDPIGDSFDDRHHDDKDFLEDNDQEMKKTDETKAAIWTNKQGKAKKPQIIKTGNETRLQYTISNSGQLQIILNRYIFSFHYKRNRTDDLVWRCLNNRQKCAATLITKNGKIVRRSKAHNHPFADKSVLKRLQKGIVYAELKDAQEMVNAKKKDKNPNTPSSPSMIMLDDDD